MKVTPTYQNYAVGLLRFYPRAWRKRYADEARAVLEERPATLLTLCDLILGMMDAHLHNDLFTERKFVMLQRLRSSQVTIFCVSILTVLLWLAAQLFHMILRTYAAFNPELAQINYNQVQTIINLAGFCSLLATVVGGIALIGATLKQAITNKRKGFSRLFIGWLLGILGLLAITLLIYVPRKFGISFMDLFLSIHFFYTLTTWIVFLLIVWTVIVGPFCLFLGVLQAEFTPHFMRVTFIPALISALAMSIMTIAMLLLAVELSLSAPDLSGLKRTLFFDATVVCMALLTVLAYVSLWRGFSAQRKLALA